MPENPKVKVQEQNERIRRAFRRVFGLKGQRTADQEIVLNVIIEEGYVYKNTWIPNDDMNTDPYRAAIAEGKRITAIGIMQRADSKPTSKEDQADKPKSITK